MRYEQLFLCFFLLLLQQGNSGLRGRKCYIDYSLGTCTLLSECQPIVSEILTGGQPMPLYMKNKLERIQCGYHGVEPMICCVPSSDPDEINSRLSNAQETISESYTTENTAPDAKIPDIHNHPNLELLPTNCGVSDNNRIVGGNRTNLFEMPWMVLLSYISVRGTELNCGGTLINEWYVLTAAHCLVSLPRGLELRSVVLGEYDINQNPDCEDYYGKHVCAPPIKTVPVAEAVAHPGYSKETLVDDIALIRLSEPADFSLDSMKPICLPLTSRLQKENLVGKNGVVAGWGATEDGVQSSVLLKISLPIISKEECQVPYKGQTEIHDQQLCAGGVKGKDSCGGDSGGPLMFPGFLGVGGVKTVQRGIVSFGTKLCGMAGVPGVYTNIAYYMDWILDTIHS